jgi:hypothetical protein
METAGKNRSVFDTSAMLEFLFTRHPLGPLHISQQLDEPKFVQLLHERSSQPLGWPPRVSQFLRGWVNEWISSAVSVDGTEKPSERKFEKDGNLGKVVLDYSKQNRIELIAAESGLHLFFAPYPQKPGVAALAGIPSMTLAQESFVFFLLSELRFRLAKCRKEGCDRYFVLKHWTRTYKRGTFCPSCQRARSLESASRSKSGDRARAEEKLTELAARRFAKRIRANRNWSQDKALKDSLVKFLNGRIERDDLLRAVYFGSGRRGITSKWLGHAKNRNKIEAIVKGAA